MHLRINKHSHLYFSNVLLVVSYSSFNGGTLHNYSFLSHQDIFDITIVSCRDTEDNEKPLLMKLPVFGLKVHSWVSYYLPLIALTFNEIRKHTSVLCTCYAYWIQEHV